MIQTSTQFDYSRKRDIGYKEIMAPEGDPAWIFDRQVLWNKVENSEKRVDSMLARHIDAALRSSFLGHLQGNGEGVCEDEFHRQGHGGDVAFHDMDSHNPHAHILLTTREIEGDGFADKKCAAWQASYNTGGGRVLVANGTIEVEREYWVVACNKALEKQAKKPRIDHRSFKRQGIDKIPTFHIGKDAWHLRSGASPPPS